MMDFQEKLEINQKIMGGKPVIRGTRIPAYLILQMIRDGSTFEKIIEGYPRLTKEDIQAVLDYSIYLINEEENEEINLVQ